MMQMPLSRRVRLAAIALLLVAIGLIAEFGFFYFRDNFSTHYPIKVIASQVYRACQIPWWNFYDGGGQPLAGNPNTLTFYPDNFLYLIVPAHVAFNLHFLIHVVLAWFAVAALCRQSGSSLRASRFAASMYAMSGLVISATAFYNLITAVALIPFAFWAVENIHDDSAGQRSSMILSIPFGLMALAGEPLIVLSAAMGAAILFVARKVTLARLWTIALAAVMSAVIASPQLIAYAEIAGEVERSRMFPSKTALTASLWPVRILEIAAGPIIGFLTDAGHAEFRGRLFSTIFFGVIVIPAVVMARRARYAVIAALMLFLALGRFNPMVSILVDSVPSLRMARYPEKFAMALTVALAVLVAAYIDLLARKWVIVWGVITFIPLALCIVHGTPIDWFAPYRLPPMPSLRVCSSRNIEFGTHPARSEYRTAAHTMPPIFGAAGGLRYVTDRSPEGMHSLMSRIVAERAALTAPAIREQYQRIGGCSIPGALPMAWIVPRVIGIRSVNEEVTLIEGGRFDERAAALAPAKFADFVSPPAARVTGYEETLQDVIVSVSTPAPALLFVNQSFFRAWSAWSGNRELSTVPLDIDRLGVFVPAGQHTIVLRFGRHRLAVAAAWAASSLLLIAAAFALGIQNRDRRTGKVERSGDEDRPLA
jgi:hypothetical protein